MHLVCKTDLYHKGKRYKKGDSIKIDQSKISAFISKGWVEEAGQDLEQIEVEAKELKPKRKTKELKIDAQTKNDEANQD